MAFDGIITYTITRELRKKLVSGKIDRIYQPGPEELLLHIHTMEGNYKLFMTCNSMSARICLTDNRYENPEQPPAFCMLMRKHLQSGRILDIRQKDSERLIEIDIEAQNEMGFKVSKRLIVEIMSKHSNITLVDLETGKVIDSIKRISIDVNRYRQLLPGIVYEYPPKQDKTGFLEINEDINLPHDEKALMVLVSGISPAIARELIEYNNPSSKLIEILKNIDEGEYTPTVYFDGKKPVEFQVTALREYEGTKKIEFKTASDCVEYFYTNRDSSNLIKQKSMPLMKTVQSALDKAKLKRKKLSEDLLKAEKSDKYQLYGELITANIHVISAGVKSVILTNYYDNNKQIEIPLDEKISASKNAQNYFKKYSKAKTAIHEKTSQLEENEQDIKYLESVVQNIENSKSVEELDAIRDELEGTGYVKRRQKAYQRKKKSKLMPIKYVLSDGTMIYVGKNNVENDYLSMKFASKTDVWMHTKDIPGSHLIVKLDDGRKLEDLSEELIYEAASIAAFHSKAKESDNVPVDFVPIRYVKKPNGAKPGMVIFTHNQTVYVKPKEGVREEK